MAKLWRKLKWLVFFLGHGVRICKLQFCGFRKSIPYSLNIVLIAICKQVVRQFSYLAILSKTNIFNH